MVSGQCTFNAGGKHGLVAPAGTFVAVPGRTEHSFTVDKPNTHMLNFYLPAGFEQLLIGIAHPAEYRAPPPKDKIQEMLPPPWLAEKLSEDYGQKSVLGNPFVDKPDPAKMLTRPLPGAMLFPYTVNIAAVKSLYCMGGSWRVLADTVQTGGCYCLFHVIFDNGLIIKPRMYRDRDEMFYVLCGELDITLGDRKDKITKGSFVYIPSGTVYSLDVRSGSAQLLNLHTRSGFDRLIRAVGSEDTLAGYKTVEPGVRENILEDIGLVELGELVAPL